MGKGTNGHEVQQTRRMMAIPITALAKLIGAKWYSSVEKLADAAGVPKYAVTSAINGKRAFPKHEKKLRDFLESL